MLVLGVAGLAVPLARAAAQTPAGPERCTIGLYLSDIYDLDTTQRTFGADV